MHMLPPSAPPSVSLFHTVQALAETPVQGVPRFLQLDMRNVDLTPEREEVLIRARREGILRGWRGEPRIAGETVTSMGISILVEFPPASPLDAGPSTPVPASPKTSSAQAKASWVLVIPVEDGGGGVKGGWGSGEWGKLWSVPLRASGIRLVPTLGDSEDRESLTPPMVADPGHAAAGMGLLARKYGAPAVAILRLERDGVMRAWMLRAGAMTTAVGDTGTDDQAKRRAGGELLAGLLTNPAQGTRNDEAVPLAADERISPMLKLVSRRANDITVLCDTSDTDEQAEARRIIRALPGLRLVSSRVTEEGLVLLVNWAGTDEDLANALAAAGATVVQ